MWGSDVQWLNVTKIFLKTICIYIYIYIWEQHEILSDFIIHK